jgi:rhodanese-related sulfurtransferase
VAAVKAGFTQVYWFRGGYPEWIAKGHPAESAPEKAALPR